MQKKGVTAMSKIALIGAGGVIFAQNFMKDILLDEDLRHH